MLDATDFKILELLSGNARMQWREIGEQVHLTGQAVANRIRVMQESGVIEGFTVKTDPGRLGKPLMAYVTVFMKSTDHQAFHGFVKGREEIREADQISGEGCYMLKVNVSGQDELLNLLNEILQYGNYRVNLSIGRVKG